MLQIQIKPYTLQFNFSARTSRGVLHERKVWFIQVMDSLLKKGIGEVAPIGGLSIEKVEEVEEVLNSLSQKKDLEPPNSEAHVYEIVSMLVPPHFSSVRMGLETALLDFLNGGKRLPFSPAIDTISMPINGLVWMGNEDFMTRQIHQKLDDGFDCIKLKIGALDFDVELEIVKKMRRISEELIIRLDANGGFQLQKVLQCIKKLSQYNIHSIEQPILPKQYEAMEMVCHKSEIPIALDEDLVGIYSAAEKTTLLSHLKPQYIVFKPTIHGGFHSVNQWIEIADSLSIKWWITSYLESNVGLNAITQFAHRYTNSLHHGLGTGALYQNNIASPLFVKEGNIGYDASKSFKFDSLFD